MSEKRKRAIEEIFRDLPAEVQRRQIEELTRSWCLQPRGERIARRAAVVLLSAELAKIREVSLFSTALGEQVIEDIILGDWEAAELGGQYFTFAHESQELRDQYRSLWSNFVLLVQAACASAKSRSQGVKSS